MLTRNELREKIAKIIEEKKITTPKKLCRSITMKSVITDYLHTVVDNITDKACEIIYDRAMEEFHKRLDHLLTDCVDNIHENEEINTIVDEIYEYIERDVLPVAVRESENELPNALNDIKNLIREVVSEAKVYEEGSEEQEECVNRCIDKIVDKAVEDYVCFKSISGINYDYLYREVYSVFGYVFDVAYDEFLDEVRKK